MKHIECSSSRRESPNYSRNWNLCLAPERVLVWFPFLLFFLPFILYTFSCESPPPLQLHSSLSPHLLRPPRITSNGDHHNAFFLLLFDLPLTRQHLLPLPFLELSYSFTFQATARSRRRDQDA